MFITSIAIVIFSENFKKTFPTVIVLRPSFLNGDICNESNILITNSKVHLSAEFDEKYIIFQY